MDATMHRIERHGIGLSRRQFVVTALTAAGGFALGIAAPGLAEAATLARQAARPATAMICGDKSASDGHPRILFPQQVRLLCPSEHSS